jgi:two-component system sensor histidine kinase PilS (NtrC family)
VRIKLVLNVTTDEPTAGFPTVDFWRSLRYFNLYRLTLASIFVFLAGAFGSSLSLGAYHLLLFFGSSVVYLAVVVVSFIPLRLRWPRFTWQLAGQIGADIVGLTVLSYASGGIQSSIGLLLLVSLAAAGLISRGKITLFFAALASIAALLEHTYAVLYDDADVAQYVQVGLLCMSYFAVAWLAHTLAKYAVDSQLLAQRRGRDLVSLSEANRLVMRDMQDGVLVVDGEGMIMQMNARAERLLRKSIGPESSLSATFPILFGQYALWKQAGSASRDTLQLDVGLQARLRFVPIERDAANGAVIFLEDMQRVRAEAQQIKLAALGRLTANIAHEVRNPLSAISYATELLQEEPGDAKHQRLLQIVLDNTQRINQIVQDVMQLNRRDRAQPEVFELEAMLRTFVEEFDSAERFVPKAGNPLAGKLAVELTQPGVMVLAGMPGVEVSCDRGHLRQVLWNLCRNALRYGRMLPGSMVLTMSAEDGRVMLAVQDDGPGISVEHQGKLFEPFFTTAPDGTGLGLYIAKELCEANGALLEYHADEGQAGACFRITFGELHRDGGGHGHDG